MTPQPFPAETVYDADGRHFPLRSTRATRSAVLSFRVPEEHPLWPYLGRRSFVYDDALALIAQVAQQHHPEARAIGETLAALVTPQGDIGFSFELNDQAFYDRDYVRAGVVAWAAYALALYDLETGEDRFRTVARRLADTLLASRVTTPGDPRAGLIPAGRGRWQMQFRRFDRSFVADYCVMEHQFDGWFLLRTLAALDPTSHYGVDADRLAASIDAALWLPEGRYGAAVTRDGVVRTPALDAAGAWGALFLAARGETVRANRAIAYVRATFSTHIEGLDGFAPYAGPVPDHPGIDLSHTLSGEGTAAVGVALLRLGRRLEAERIAQDLSALQHRQSGGLLYAYPAEEEFPDLPAMASTAWLFFLQMELEGHPPTVFAPPQRPR